MAISFVAAASAAHTSSSSTLTLNKPAGVQQGDVLIAVVGVVDETITNPTGWTTLETLTTAHAKGHLAYKVAGASEPTSYDWTLNQSQDDVAGSLVAFRGVDTGAPVRDSAVAEVNNTTTPASPALTGTQATDMVVAFGSGRSSSSGPNTEITAPNTAGWTAAVGAHSGDSDPGSFPQSTDAAYQVNGGTATFTSNANVNTVMFAASLIAGASGGVTGDLAVSAPVAQASLAGELEVDGTAGLTAPLAQVDVTANLTVDGTAGITAPVAQVDASGSAAADFLRAVAPVAQADVTAEVTDTGTLDATAPLAQVDVVGNVDLPGVLNAVAPVAQADVSATVEVSGTADATAPLAQVDVSAELEVDATLAATAPVAQLAGTGESDTQSTFAPVAPLAQVSISVTNHGQPEVNYEILPEAREIVVEPDIPRETYYV